MAPDRFGFTIWHVIGLSWLLIAGAGIFVILRGLFGFVRRGESPGVGEGREGTGGAEEKAGR